MNADAELWRHLKMKTSDEKGSVAFNAVIKDLPDILTRVVARLASLNSTTLVKPNDAPKVDESKLVISNIGGIIYQIKRNRELPLLRRPDYDDVVSNAINKTWLHLPWLFVEAFTYIWVHEMFLRTKHWQDFDYFSHIKKQSCLDIADYDIPLDKCIAHLSGSNNTDPSELLSFLNHMSHVHLVVEATGPQLHECLVLALHLLQSSKKVTIQCKRIPWYMNHATVDDVMYLICTWYQEKDPVLHAKLSEHLERGSLDVQASPLWTSAPNPRKSPFESDRALFESLSHKETVIIFVGEVNFRRLVMDAQDERSFTEAIGPWALFNVASLHCGVHLHTQTQIP